MCTTYSARNNVVSHTLFYRPIYYNQKNERRENISTYQNTQRPVRVLSSTKARLKSLNTAKSTASVRFSSFILAFSIHIYYQRTLLHFLNVIYREMNFLCIFFSGGFKICFVAEQRKKPRSMVKMSI
jgi:hypothetical protein